MFSLVFRCNIYSVIVAPYWNVNTDYRVIGENGKYVIVAPYWNVNKVN